MEQVRAAKVQGSRRDEQGVDAPGKSGEKRNKAAGTNRRTSTEAEKCPTRTAEM